ncbi:hypothetical protein [Cohnella caldifontis]|uniref:hypothetical protein n=1 Tax=Cohnella caldifontis TaxID=3027471 RepID=UPI0023EAE502|nr:hypothetical protein [Cohnella sp. YIM B05605]
MNRPYPPRRIRALLAGFGTTTLHPRNPWTVMFFAFSFPGFGYLMLQRYLAAFLFIVWEMFINTKAKINSGILYTLLGDFDKAREVMDERWLILYVTIYLFNIWDSYRLCTDLNKQYLLAEREKAPIENFKMTPLDINFMDKKQPWLAFWWSFFAPGVGHLYIHKFLTGLFISGAMMVLMYYSRIPQGMHFTAAGDFAGAKRVLDMQWAMYLPSMYAFIVYDAYDSAVEQNKLFETEQSEFLRRQYLHPSFPMPLRER